MASIGSVASFSGLASGIQWRDLVDQIITVESTPVVSLQSKIDAARLRTRTWSDFQKKVQALKDASTAVADKGLRAKRVDVSAPSLLSASVTEDASPGQHSVRVLGIASAETLGGDLFASRTTALGLSGDLRVAGTTIGIAAGDSLDEIARRFNDVRGTTGVTASVLSAGAGSYRLILATGRTGASGIDLVDGSAGVLRALGLLDATVATKHGTTSGARSDLFGDATTAAATLLGFTGMAPSTVSIGGVNVLLDLGTMSLTDVAGAINTAAAGAGRAVTASVIDDGSQKRLDIRNTTSFTDSGRVLEALGVLKGGRGSEAHAVQSEELRTNGNQLATSGTRLNRLWSQGVDANVANGDTFSITGTRGDGSTFSFDYTVTGTNTVGDLLSRLNSATDGYKAGGRTATATIANGRIVVTDDTGGSSRLDLRIVANNQGGGTLDFGTFGVLSAGRARQITAGADAEVEIDGVYLRQSTNTVSDAVPGLTLRLGAADPNTTAIVNVSGDAQANTAAVKALIDAYNDLAEFVDVQLRPPPEGQAAAPLYNDSVLRTMRSTLRTGLGAVLDATVTGGPARLLDIGIEIDKRGRFTIDETKLADAVENQSEALARLFGVYGTTAGTGLTYLSATDRTRHGSYAIEVTQLAAAADVTGAGFGGAYVDDGTADSLDIRDVLNGRTYSIALANGMTMSQIVSALNTQFATPLAHGVAAGNALTDGTGAAVTDATAWADVNFPPGTNAGVTAGDVLTISGNTPAGTAFAKSIPVGATGTLGELRAAVQSAIGPDVEVYWDAGVLSARMKTPGSKTFSLDITSNNAGGGSLDFAGFAITQQGRGTSGITAKDNGGQLQLVHDEYGTAAGFEVSFTAGGADGSASLGFGAGTFVGVDAAGTIGGFATTGAGRLLTGAVGTPVQGMIVAYEGAAAGAVGTVTFSRGIGSRLELLGKELLGSGAGSIEAVSGRIESSITLMSDRIEALESRLERRHAQLIKRFSAMERAMSMAQSQSAWLESQVRQLQQSQSA